MNLAHLLPELRSNSSLKRLVKSISVGLSLAVDDLPLAARPAVIAAMSESVDRPVIVVSSRSDRSDVLASAVSEFLDNARNVVHWPAPAALPYERLPRDTDQSADFVAALARVAAAPNESIVFASAASITHAIMSPDDLLRHIYRVRRGDLLRQADLSA